MATGASSEAVGGTEVVARPVTTVKPTAGPQFRWAARQDVGGQKRRRLLCLIAAFADAGEPSPPVNVLARQANLGGWRVVDGLLAALERDGFIQVRWAGGYGKGRNAYTLRLDRNGGER
jgi:hypothetical protein